MGASSQETQASSQMQAKQSRQVGAGRNEIKFPMTGTQAAQVLKDYLWEHERKEILEYDCVYWFNVAER